MVKLEIASTVDILFACSIRSWDMNRLMHEHMGEMF